MKNENGLIPNQETIKSAVVNCLKNVYDPEIPVNIYDLGLIYNVDVDPDLNVKILMTMTAPDCPEAKLRCSRPASQGADTTFPDEILS